MLEAIVLLLVSPISLFFFNFNGSCPVLTSGQKNRKTPMGILVAPYQGRLHKRLLEDLRNSAEVLAKIQHMVQHYVPIMQPKKSERSVEPVCPSHLLRSHFSNRKPSAPAALSNYLPHASERLTFVAHCGCRIDLENGIQTFLSSEWDQNFSHAMDVGASRFLLSAFEETYLILMKGSRSAGQLLQQAGLCVIACVQFLPRLDPSERHVV
jgi:hypothetical protein